MGCMAARPIVDRIEKDFEGRLLVIRLNIEERAGMVLGEQYDLKYTPTFVFLDGEGRLLWKTIGAVDPTEVQRSLNGS
jgi:thioredoxin-related protein